jgi:hypothetical protein
VFQADEHVSPSEANQKQLYRIVDAMVVLSLGRKVIYEQSANFACDP